ncbi:hypothetical protein [Blautia hydrogenotrophica]|uniref:hypothetical protein n=1 Tax=Blautia hydrogenotrophica TaxID=53443 RepID=UPI002F3F40F3
MYKGRLQSRCSWQKPQSFQVAANEFSQVKKVIGVISGKRSVGKPSDGVLANMMAAKGHQVGIMDATLQVLRFPKCMESGYCEGE